MRFQILKEIIAVTRGAEEQRREAPPTDEDPAIQQWLVYDPLVNELCLMLLVTLRHQVERELVDFAARAADEGKAISGEQYDDRIRDLRKFNKKGHSIGWKWDEIYERLGRNYEELKSMEALRLLANSYKHDPSVEPAEDLKKLLGLPKVGYAPLPESDLFREKLAHFLGLGRDAPYTDIADRFVDFAEDFLDNVKGQEKLSNVLRVASLNPDDFAH